VADVRSGVSPKRPWRDAAVRQRAETAYDLRERVLWNIGVMSKSKAVQQMIERLSAALGLMHRGRLHLNTRDMVRVFARKRSI
jgi:hypothetical protein